jgi:hypothetical protein
VGSIVVGRRDSRSDAVNGFNLGRIFESIWRILNRNVGIVYHWNQDNAETTAKEYKGLFHLDPTIM